jgi:hypothetical protein
VAKTTARKRKKSAASAGWTQLRLEEPPPAPAPVERPLPAISGEVIAVLVADLAAELGDAANAGVHQAEAAALWRRSGLPEAEFAKVLWDVRGRLKRRPANRRGAGAVRIAAFFVLLRDQLGLVEEAERNTPPARPGRPPPYLRKR